MKSFANRELHKKPPPVNKSIAQHCPANIINGYSFQAFFPIPSESRNYISRMAIKGGKKSGFMQILSPLKK